jgi:hypothetical protein
MRQANRTIINLEKLAKAIMFKWFFELGLQDSYYNLNPI